MASTNPPFGDRGTTIDVHVIGSGFTGGAQATWLLHGVADQAHVRTNSTTFVSSTELIANVTIASDAELAFWDVQVALIGGKNGVGSEAFEVTSAQILGAGTTGGGAFVASMNDQRQVVGWSTGGAWVYDDVAGMVALGSGEAYDIDPLGTFVVGRNGSSLPTAWVRQSNNAWTAETLPRLAGSVGGNVNGATRSSDGSLFVAGWDETAPTKGKSSGNIRRPVAWRRNSDATWSAPQTYLIPNGVTTAAAYHANPLGQVVGILGAEGGIVWENPTTFAVLDAIPFRINSAGTLIVGGRNNGAAVYWWRDPSTHAWHTTGVPLPSLAGSSCAGGLARGVNDVGVIVGWSCTSSGEEKPTVWKLDLSGTAPVLVGAPAQLPGLGVKSKAFPTAAAQVTQTPPYVAAGTAVAPGNLLLAVRWNLP